MASAPIDRRGWLARSDVLQHVPQLALRLPARVGVRPRHLGDFRVIGSKLLASVSGGRRPPQLCAAASSREDVLSRAPRRLCFVVCFVFLVCPVYVVRGVRALSCSKDLVCIYNRTTCLHHIDFSCRSLAYPDCFGVYDSILMARSPVKCIVRVFKTSPTRREIRELPSHDLGAGAASSACTRVGVSVAREKSCL